MRAGGPLYAWLLRDVLFPAWEARVAGRGTLSHLAYLERTQWWSLDELLAIQAGDLRRLVRHAARNVPFYTQRFERAGLGPDDVRRPEDLAKIPILRREDVVAAGDARRSSIGPEPTIWKGTGGSTGQPVRLGYECASEAWRQAVKLRGWEWAGYRLGEPTLFYWATPPPTHDLRQQAKVLLDRALKRERYVNCMRRTEKDLSAAVDAIRELRPRTIVTYAQAGAELARFVVESGRRDWDSIAVICSAEKLWPAQRAIIAEAFGPRVFDTYGSREVMLIGAECGARSGLHTSMENLVAEVVVTEDGRERAARPGERGEVVVTDLHNFAMPFLRYAIGDVATAGPSEVCPCGRALQRLEMIEGRMTSTIRDGAGRPVEGLVFNVIFNTFPRWVRHFQAVQHKDLSVTLRVVPSDGGLSDSLRDEIQRLAARYIAGVPIRVEPVREIPPAPNGKRQVIVIER